MIDEAIITSLLAPSFPSWMAARRVAERLIRSDADEGKILWAMERARKLEVRAIAEIRSAAHAANGPKHPYLFHFEGRIFLILPDGSDVEVDDQLADQIIAIDPARVVSG